MTLTKPSLHLCKNTSKKIYHSLSVVGQDSFKAKTDDDVDDVVPI